MNGDAEHEPLITSQRSHTSTATSERFDVEEEGPQCCVKGGVAATAVISSCRSINSAAAAAELSRIIISNKEKALFFILGLAPVLAWNSIYVSEAYFYQALGPAVLSRLGLCQNFASFGIQILLLFLKRQCITYRLGVSIAMVYMMCLCLVLYLVPLHTFDPWHLYGLVSVNGLGTGMAQTLVGSLGGLYGNAGEVGAILFAGNSMGALAPPLLQVILLFSRGIDNAKSVTDVHKDNRQNAIVIFSVGAFGSLLGLASIIIVSRTRNYRQLTASREVMEENEDFKSIGANAPMAKERWAVVTVRTSQVLISLTRAVWLFLLSITPYVTPYDPHLMFWKANLATLLIAATNVGDFCGRLAANRPKWAMRNLRLLTASALARFVFLILVIVYNNSDALVHAVGKDNILILCVYFLMSATHGFLLVCLQTKAQAACGFYPGEDSCPVISQFSWLSSQIGLVLGIGFSFVPTT